MAKFNVGDVVKRTEGSFRGTEVGGIYKVTSNSGRSIILEGLDGSYDETKFELHTPIVPPVRVIQVPRCPGKARTFAIGDRVRMINHNPEHARGNVDVGDIGVIIAPDEYNDGEWRIDFPAQSSWLGQVEDIEHEFPESELDLLVASQTPEISLDEAVSNWQNVSQQMAALQSQIAELQTQAKAYEQVMRKAGVQPI